MDIRHSGYEVDWELPTDAQLLDDHQVGTGTNEPEHPRHRRAAANFSASLAETNGAALNPRGGHGSAPEAERPVDVRQ
jgi:hypothetical protein